MSTISIKVKNQQQAEKFEQIFKQVCERTAPLPILYSPDDQYFNVNLDDCSDWCWLDDYPREEKKTWREFILAYLENRYVVVDTPEEKMFLIDFFEMPDLMLKTKAQRAADLYYNLLFFEKGSRDYFYPSSRGKGDKKEISFAKVKLLLNSVEEFERQEFITEQEITTKFKPEELVLIAAILGHSPLPQVRNYVETFCLRHDIDKSQIKKVNNVSLYADLEKLVENNKNLLAPPKIEEFSFSCSLKTQTKNKQITIGCQTKSAQEWLDYANKIIELNLDNVEVDVYSFERSEIIRFRDWLKENFNL